MGLVGKRDENGICTNQKNDVRGAPCDKDDDACSEAMPSTALYDCCVSCYSGRALDLCCASNAVFTHHLNSYCLVLSCLLSCVVLCVLCCVVRVLYVADLDTWTPSISIRGPSRRAISRRRNRKLGLALYA